MKCAGTDAERGLIEHLLIEKWVRWRQDVRKHGPAPIKSSMHSVWENGRIKAHDSGPDAEMPTGMAYIERAYMALKDAYPIEWACFTVYYVKRSRKISEQAAQIGIARQRFYEKKNAYRAKMLAWANEIQARGVI